MNGQSAPTKELSKNISLCPNGEEILLHLSNPSLWWSYFPVQTGQCLDLQTSLAVAIQSSVVSTADRGGEEVSVSMCMWSPPMDDRRVLFLPF